MWSTLCSCLAVLASFSVISVYGSDDCTVRTDGLMTVKIVNDTDHNLSASILVYNHTHEVNLLIREVANFSFVINGIVSKPVELLFHVNGGNVISNIIPHFIKPGNYVCFILDIVLNATNVGHTLVVLSATPVNMIDTSGAYMRISVSYAEWLNYFSDVVGWLYFVAWSVSFYPQIFVNYKRKSVIGFNFDFVGLNIIGFFMYSVFNIGLYFIEPVQQEYFSKHPFGIIPVQINDVIFSVHAFFACFIQVVQCMIYEKGDQTVSQTGRSILGAIFLSSSVALILSLTSVIALLNLLYFVSYVKLFITLIKYIPQAHYNFQRKSTSGWSIGNILLDFTGGVLSIIQMFILAYNYSDWESIFGDPTKFGLGLASILFDIIFIVQHYVLYRGREDYCYYGDPPLLPNHEQFNASDSYPNYGAVDNRTP